MGWLALVRIRSSRRGELLIHSIGPEEEVGWFSWQTIKK